MPELMPNKIYISDIHTELGLSESGEFDPIRDIPTEIVELTDLGIAKMGISNIEYDDFLTLRRLNFLRSDIPLRSYSANVEQTLIKLFQNGVEQDRDRSEIPAIADGRYWWTVSTYRIIKELSQNSTLTDELKSELSGEWWSRFVKFYSREMNYSWSVRGLAEATIIFPERRDQLGLNSNHFTLMVDEYRHEVITKRDVITNMLPYLRILYPVLFDRSIQTDSIKTNLKEHLSQLEREVIDQSQGSFPRLTTIRKYFEVAEALAILGAQSIEITSQGLVLHKNISGLTNDTPNRPPEIKRYHA